MWKQKVSLHVLTASELSSVCAKGGLASAACTKGTSCYIYRMIVIRLFIPCLLTTLAVTWNCEIL